MGLLASTVRIRMLCSQKMDLQYNLMLITQAMCSLSNSKAALEETGTDYTDPDSAESKRLKARMAKLEALEKRLAAQQDQYKTKLDMINTELESAKEVRKKAIEEHFKY